MVYGYTPHSFYIILSWIVLHNTLDNLICTWNFNFFFFYTFSGPLCCTITPTSASWQWFALYCNTWQIKSWTLTPSTAQVLKLAMFFVCVRVSVWEQKEELMEKDVQTSPHCCPRGRCARWRRSTGGSGWRTCWAGAAPSSSADTLQWRGGGGHHTGLHAWNDVRS